MLLTSKAYSVLIEVLYCHYIKYIYVVCGPLSYECNVTVHCCLNHAYYIAMSMMYRGHIFSLTPTSLQEVKTKHVSLAQA